MPSSVVGEFADERLGQHKLQQMIRTGSAGVVEGTIDDFHPMLYSGHGSKESFRVDGVRFSYSDFEDSPGYTRSESHGGVLHAGMRVRLHYYKGSVLNCDNPILQVEIPSSAKLESHSQDDEDQEITHRIWFGLFALFFTFMGVYVLLFQLYAAAARAGRAARMRRIGAWLARVNGPLMRVLIDIDILLVEERWADALKRLDNVPSNAAEKVKLGCDNNRAWCKLQLGDPETALALAESVCASSVNVGAARRANFEGTRAIALFLCGRISESLPALETAVKSPAPTKRSLSIRWFYLGEARRAADHADATIAYQRACGADPGGPWAKRAEARLIGNAYR